MDYNPQQAETEMLFEQLRKLRKRIADAQSVPPYVIFADSSLKSMAQKRPQNLTDFSLISGVGVHKLKQYGDKFVSEISSFCELHKLPIPLPSSSQMTTWQFYQQGMNPKEIAQERGLAIGTIYHHLSELIEMNQPIDINKLVDKHKQEFIIHAIEKVGADSLKILKENLGEDYSYEEIKLVRAWQKSKQN